MLFLLATAILIALSSGQSPVEGTEERLVHAMGTTLSVRVGGGPTGSARRGAEAAVGAVEHFDRLLSTWDPSTPLSRINRAPVGAPTFVSPEVASLLVEAEAWAHRTDRTFDPTIGALVDAWGLRGKGRVPSDAELLGALARTGGFTLTVDQASGTVTRGMEGAWLDTGAFGKGAALRAAADSLRVHGIRRALLNLGGQVMALAAVGEDAWDVSVAHPSRRHERVATLRLRDASAATSGNSERGVILGDVRIGHILDPRSGVPVPWWGSVTVVSADPLEADILSTALYVMGPEAGMAWARDLPDVGVLFLVEEAGRIDTVHNQAMTAWLIERPANAGTPPSLSPERRFP
ncbi:MAG: FAD:protein FMN transferase [Longimicrobiales bacterium]